MNNLKIPFIILRQKSKLLFRGSELASIVDEELELNDQANLFISVVEHQLHHSLDHIVSEPLIHKHIMECVESLLLRLIALEEHHEATLVQVAS